MYTSFATALLVCATAAIKTSNFKQVSKVANLAEGTQFDHARHIGKWLCDVDEETRTKWAFKQFAKADKNKSTYLSKAEYVDWVQSVIPSEEATPAMVQFWQDHQSVLFEMNDIESMGNSQLAKDGRLSFSEFDNSLDCLFGKSKIEWQIRYLNMSETEANNDTFIDLNVFTDLLIKKQWLNDFAEEDIYSALNQQSDDNRLTFVEIWLAFERLAQAQIMYERIQLTEEAVESEVIVTTEDDQEGEEEEAKKSASDEEDVTDALVSVEDDQEGKEEEGVTDAPVTAEDDQEVKEEDAQKSAFDEEDDE